MRKSLRSSASARYTKGTKPRLRKEKEGRPSSNRTSRVHLNLPPETADNLMRWGYLAHWLVTIRSHFVSESRRGRRFYLKWQQISKLRSEPSRVVEALLTGQSLNEWVAETLKAIKELVPPDIWYRVRLRFDASGEFLPVSRDEIIEVEDQD